MTDRTMPYGISLKGRDATADYIRRLWDEASIYEPIGSMQELNYPPHLTLAVFPEGGRVGRNDR